VFISRLVIKNFRRFNEKGIEIDFKSGINILIGENNIGKTAIIDAMRLVMTAGQYRRNLYVTIDDFHIDEYGRRAGQFNIDIYFEDLTEEQGTAFYLLTDGNENLKAEVHLSYQLQKDSRGNDKVKEYITGGSGENTKISDAFSNINIIFLAALRNAENDLKPSRTSQIAHMLTTVAADESDKKRLLAEFIKANNVLRKDSAIVEIESIINSNLTAIEKEELTQKISVNVIEPTFEAISASLDVSYIKDQSFVIIDKQNLEDVLSDMDITISELISNRIAEEIDETYRIELVDNTKYSEMYKKIIENPHIHTSVKQNGLGYNNILSMAASLGDLQKTPQNEEFSVFLVEEPEAHLHPQLLELLFNFFEKSGKDSGIQLFLTSHSPTLVSKAKIDSLNIIHDCNSNISSTALSKIIFSEDKEEHESIKSSLERYLDVTKSQLFFAKRVAFVEGISEAILISVFAKILGKPFDKYSVEIVNINGVAFEPFAKLFMSSTTDAKIKIPCVIISDDDRCTNNDDENRFSLSDISYSSANYPDLVLRIKNGDISHRAQNLKSFDNKDIGVELAKKTLEYELGLIKSNNELLVKILEAEHPTIAKDISNRIKAGDIQDEIAARFLVAFKDCKGSYAQRLAYELSSMNNSSGFIVPDYIINAINNIIPN